MTKNKHRGSSLDSFLRETEKLKETKISASMPAELDPADHARIIITDDMEALLRAEFARTGLRFDTVFNGAEDKPPKLNARVVRGWLYREADTANAHHWRCVIGLLAKTPDLAEPLPMRERKHRKARVTFPDHRPLTDEERSALRFQRERTGIGGAVLLRGATDKPEGLTASMISAWMGDKPPRANPAYVRYVLERYSAR